MLDFSSCFTVPPHVLLVHKGALNDWPSTVLYLRHCVNPRHIKHSRRWINIMKGKMAELPLSVTSGCRWHSVQEQMSVCNLLRQKEKMRLFKMNFYGFHIREWALFVLLSQRQRVPKLPSCCLCVLFSSIEGYHLTNTCSGISLRTTNIDFF